MKGKVFVLGAAILGLSSAPMMADGPKCTPDGDCPNKIESVAQPYENNNNNNNGAPKAKKLLMDSVEKFQGTIKSVSREKRPDGKMFIKLVLETKEHGEVNVMVGPARYVDQSKVALQADDKITVMGFRVGANGTEVIMAKQIDKNGNILELLNDKRQPLWDNQ